MNTEHHHLVGYFYDDTFGELCRAKYAKVDTKGVPQWVNITPGEESGTLAAEDADLDTRHVLLCMDGDDVQPAALARMLAARMASPVVGDVEAELHDLLHQLDVYGVNIDLIEPLGLQVSVYRSKKLGDKEERLHFAVYERLSGAMRRPVGGVDGFDDVKTLFRWVDIYLAALRSAGVRLCTELRISDELRKLVHEVYIDIFDHLDITDEKH